MREYPIWGVPAGGDAETILYTRAATLAEARRVAAILEDKHGCTAVRIQSLDLSAPGESVAEAFRAAVPTAGRRYTPVRRNERKR